MVNTINKSRSELLELAKSTSDNFLLTELSFDVDSMVRRAIARNTNTPSNILNTLLKDPVLNVSYMASMNPNCPASKTFSKDINHPCVNCTKDERSMQCTNCERLSSYKIA